MATRRSFLKGSAASVALSLAAGAGASAVFGKTKSGMKPGPGNKWPGRVVINFNSGATNGSKVDETVSKKMIDDAVLLLTGENTVGAAWKSVFPATLSAQSIIAIKTNILNDGLPCPHASTVQAITEGLLLMDFGGVNLPAGNITIYDMNNVNSLEGSGYTSERFPGIGLVKDAAGRFGDGALDDREYARTLHKCDFLINVFSPRGHSIGSTFTLGFKSHYGSYANASALHKNAPQNHRDINCAGPVYEKTVLSVCSGLFGKIEGVGPGGGADDYSNYVKSIDPESQALNPSTIIMSTDPVSCDMQAVKMMRLNKNPAGNYGIADMPSYLRASAGIEGALSGQVYNIGVIDETVMDVRRIVNGVAAVTTVRPHLPHRGFSLHSFHFPGRRIAFIEYSVPQAVIGSGALIEISTIKGELVFSIVRQVCGVRNHFSWNEVPSTGGRTAPPGVYAVSVKIGTMRIAGRLHIT